MIKLKSKIQLRKMANQLNRELKLKEYLKYYLNLFGFSVLILYVAIL